MSDLFTTTSESMLRGQLTTMDSIRQYVEAGHATLTIRSKPTGTRLTFKFVRPDPEPGRARPIFVRLLTGPDNERHFKYLGCIWPEGTPAYRFGTNRRELVATPGFKVASWFARCVGINSPALLEQAEVWHEGSCGRCGRKLTVPESVASGFGPDCLQYIGRHA